MKGEMGCSRLSRQPVKTRLRRSPPLRAHESVTVRNVGVESSNLFFSTIQMCVSPGESTAERIFAS